VTDLRERERSATTVLDAWPWEHGGCLIGGYAVAAYGKPRYSQDLDFVAPAGTSEAIADWLIEMGFVLRVRKKSEETPPVEDARTYDNGDVSLDLMSGRVRDRGTEVSIPEATISTRSRRLRLELINGSTEGQVAVCRPEMLWVLKLTSARDQDLSDLFAVSDEPVAFSEIWQVLERHQTPKLISNLKQIPQRLDSKKIFLDALSARSIRTQGNLAEARRWSRFVSRLEPLRSVESFPFRIG
jgi:hypothetical protein